MQTGIVPVSEKYMSFLLFFMKKITILPFRETNSPECRKSAAYGFPAKTIDDASFSANLCAAEAGESKPEVPPE